jgi:hypothetical protein
MTVGEIKGQVLLKITGGEPSSDNSVWLSDIEPLIAPAVNYVQTKQYFIDRQTEDDKHLIQHFMLQVFTVSITEDTVRKRKRFTLPKTPLSLPNGRALQFVGDVRGRGWIPLSQGAEDMQEYYGKYKKNVTSYRPEGLNVYLWNVGPMVTEALVKMLVNVNDLTDADEVLLPSGGELEVITLIYEWISGQREIPKDLIIDQKDKISA